MFRESKMEYIEMHICSRTENKQLGGDYMKSGRTVFWIVMIFFIMTLCGCNICRHIIITDPAVSPSCTENGLTEGKHCAKCSKVLVQQTSVQAVGHQYSDWTLMENASTGQWMEMRYCYACGNTEYLPVDIPAASNSLGSAGKLWDTTLIVSIYSEDAYTYWDFNTNTDAETAYMMLDNLGFAVDWIGQQCNNYGVASNFIYRWDLYQDLWYTCDFHDANMVRSDGSGYESEKYFIETYIPSEQLKEKYHAQNIIYVFYFNTSEQNTVNSWTLSDQNNCELDIINVFVRDDYSMGYYYMSASCFAHEILHCFGARDLYYASAEIPQAFVDYCYSTGSNDIMYTVGLGTEITQNFSQLDAYYVGLTEYCDLVPVWGLAESTHAQQP